MNVDIVTLLLIINQNHDAAGRIHLLVLCIIFYCLQINDITHKDTITSETRFHGEISALLHFNDQLVNAAGPGSQIVVI